MYDIYYIMEPTPMNMSFQEKSIWVSLIIILLAFGSYFSNIYDGLQAGSLNRQEIVGLFVGLVVTIIVLQIAGHIVVALASPKDADQPGDERDKLISLKAEMPGGLVLGFGVVTLSLYLMFNDVQSVIIANLLLLLVVVSQVVTYLLQIFWYRRGF